LSEKCKNILLAFYNKVVNKNRNKSQTRVVSELSVLYSNNKSAISNYVEMTKFHFLSFKT